MCCVFICNRLFLLHGFINWFVCHCLMSALPLPSFDCLITCTWRPAWFCYKHWQPPTGHLREAQKTNGVVWGVGPTTWPEGYRRGDLCRTTERKWDEKKGKKARGFKGQWSRQNHEGGVQVWRDEETHIARTVVYQAGGERETDEPPPLLCYSGGHVFKRLLIWLFGPPPLTLVAFGHG